MLFERGLDPGQARATRRALHRPRQDHADRRAGRGPSAGSPSGKRPRRPGSLPFLERCGGGGKSTCSPHETAAPRASRAATGRVPRTGCAALRCSIPACGSGNFLYLALHALKDLEHHVQLEAEAIGPSSGPFRRSVSPANVKGIEINPYAAELARVSVWIGEIQWMRRNGFTGDARSGPGAARQHRVSRRDPDAERVVNRSGRRPMS